MPDAESGLKDANGQNRILYKTVRQFESRPLSGQDMDQLIQIAEDYRTVKQYLYRRYGGIKSYAKLYEGFRLQNEMTASGLREQLGMPSVYFHLAVRDALGDLKRMWSTCKKDIRGRIRSSEHFSLEQSHYLYYVLKMDACFQQVLLYHPCSPPEQVKAGLSAEEIHRLDNYLRRQTRKCLKLPSASDTLCFKAAERAYRYDDGGIYLSTKKKRKRVFVPLTDGNQYTAQISIFLNAGERTVSLYVPVKIAAREHRDYKNPIGLAMGYSTMLTTSTGSRYGTSAGDYFSAGASLVREHMKRKSRITQLADGYRNEGKPGLRKAKRIEDNNMGDGKYCRKRKKWEAGLVTYINQEINRMIREEKPEVIYLPHWPVSRPPGKDRLWNARLTMWRRGYIRRRLREKCAEHSIQFVEVHSGNMALECSGCGEPGKRKDGWFTCPCCGLVLEEKVNMARNVLLRGIHTLQS